MAWSHADFEAEASDAERLAALRLHIAEVSAEIGANLSMGDRSRDNAPLVNYRTGLYARLRELESRVGSADSTDKRITSTWTRGRAVD